MAVRLSSKEAMAAAALGWLICPGSPADTPMRTRQFFLAPRGKSNVTATPAPRQREYKGPGAPTSQIQVDQGVQTRFVQAAGYGLVGTPQVSAMVPPVVWRDGMTRRRACVLFFVRGRRMEEALRPAGSRTVCVLKLPNAAESDADGFAGSGW